MVGGSAEHLNRPEELIPALKVFFLPSHVSLLPPSLLPSFLLPPSLVFSSFLSVYPENKPHGMK